MEYIALLKNRKSAMIDTSKSEQVPLEQRKQLQDSIKLMNYSSWAAKGLILTGAVFGVDWKKSVPWSKREIPLTLGAIGLTMLSDYLISEYIWQKHEESIVNYTGFTQGVYISPEKMKKMKTVYSKGGQMMSNIADKEDYLYDEDEN